VPTPRPVPRRQSPRTNTDPPPRTLESYPPRWQEVIGRAKRAFRAYVAGQCGFPDPISGIQEARECLEDALEVLREEGATVEPGKFEPNCTAFYLTQKIGYMITREMAMLVRS